MMNQTHPIPSAAGPLPERLLTLQMPRTLEPDFTDWLMAQSPHPFCLLPAHEIGQQVLLGSTMEQVQGRAQRVLVLITLPQAELCLLLAALKTAWPDPDIRYWVQPVLDAGSLA